MNTVNCDKLWINAQLACFADEQYGLLAQAAIAVQAGKIVWLGKMAELPSEMIQSAQEVIDVAGKCITPGLIDCHTHVVYAGNRANEFEMRLNGMSYAQIAKAGGGIRATVAATRQASEAELLAQSLPRVQAMIAQGVSVLEIKSGYGLDLATEMKM